MPMPPYPYTNFHELNLDWIIEQVKKCYSPDNPPESVVLSVNGQTGDVVLYTDPEVTLPPVEGDAWEIKRYVRNNHTVGIAFQKNSPAMRLEGSTWYDIYDEGNPPPYPVTSVNGQTGDVTVSVPVQSVNGKTGAVTGLYDADNPPPYPVSSVNGQTGAVTITIPVQSVNGQTGAVVVPVAFKNNSTEYLMPTQDITDGNNWGIERNIQSGTTGISFEIESGHVVGYINFYDTNDQVVDRLKILTPADIPSSSGVVSVNGHTGVVTGLYDADNPPPYPVTSVNGQTGAVTISIPVSSVNGATGAVVLTGDTVPTAVGDNTPVSTKIEQVYEEAMEDIAIVVKGNKTLNAAGAAVGQYVVVRDSTIAGISDGLYTAAQSIPYNTAIDSTYLSAAISGGIANALNTNITSFSQAIDTVSVGGSYFTIDKSIIVRCGKVVIVSLDAIASKPYNANVVIGTVPSGYRPSSETNSILCFRTTSGNVATYSGFATVGTNGDIKQNITSSGATGDKITIMFAYIA